MFDVKKRIHSLALLGIERDHDDHRGAATMRSTGDLVQIFEPEDDARSWFVEYKCDVCGELVEEWNADTHDLGRQALKDAGIMEAAGSFE